MKFKKSQISIFIILGTIIIFSFIFILFMNNGNNTFDNNNELNDGNQINLKKASIKEYYGDCMKLLANDALLRHSPNKVANFIEENIDMCYEHAPSNTNFNFSYDGMNIITIKNQNDNTLEFQVDYPITIESSGTKTTISDFLFSIPLSNEIGLNLDSSGRTIQDETIRILGSKVKLTIPAGTKSTKSSNVLDSIKYEIIDTDDEENIVIDFNPSGASFDKELILTISYKDFVFPTNLDETKLGIGVFDEDKKKYIMLDGTYVNTTTKEIIGPITHFSKFTWGIVRNTSCENYTEFYDLVEDVYRNITLKYVNGSVNNDEINNTIINVLIKAESDKSVGDTDGVDLAKNEGENYINLSDLDFNMWNMTKFNISINLTNISIPPYHKDWSSELSECDEDLGFAQEYPNFVLETCSCTCMFPVGEDSDFVDVDEEGRYSIFGNVERGQHAGCQQNEIFHIEINGNMGPTSADGSCDDSQEWEYLGQFDFTSGSNKVTMKHDQVCIPGEAESVAVYGLKIGSMDVVNSSYYWIDNEGIRSSIMYEYELTPVPYASSTICTDDSCTCTEDYCFVEKTSINNYLWHAACIDNNVYAGSYNDDGVGKGFPQVFYKINMDTLKSTVTKLTSDTDTNDESSRVYSLNNKFWATTEGGVAYTENKVIRDIGSTNGHFWLGAAYYNGKYLFAKAGKYNAKPEGTQIFQCGSTGCSPVKTIDTIFTFDMEPYNNKLYLVGSSQDYTKNVKGYVYDYDSGTQLRTSNSIAVRAKTFNDKLYVGYSTHRSINGGGGASIESFDGTTWKTVNTFHKDFKHFGDFGIFDDKLFASVVKEKGNYEIWNTEDGIKWNKIFDENQIGKYGNSASLVNPSGFFADECEGKFYFLANENEGGDNRHGPSYILEISKNANSGSSTEGITYGEYKTLTTGLCRSSIPDGKKPGTCGTLSHTCKHTEPTYEITSPESGKVKIAVTPIDGNNAIYLIDWNDAMEKGIVKDHMVPANSGGGMVRDYWKEVNSVVPILGGYTGDVTVIVTARNIYHSEGGPCGFSSSNAKTLAKQTITFNVGELSN